MSGRATPVSITCPQCGRTSHNPNDVKYRYCGACHQFHNTMNLTERVLVFVKVTDDTWERIGSVAPHEQAGSITSQATGTDQRAIYIFGWPAGASGPGLWKCRDGTVDTTIDTDRIVGHTGMDLVADLRASSATITITDRGGTKAVIRFKYQEKS
jgi:hypothetical protein